MTTEATVFVVDDDPAVRKALRWLIESVGLRVEAFATAQEFLDANGDLDRPGCLVLDIRMPGISGLELQKKLGEQQISLPVIVITGHADVPMAVQALKGGAIDFLEKPVSEQMLVDRIHQALERDAQARLARARRSAVEGKLARLTPREREVFELVVAGKSNKAIAGILGVTSKTVEAHRAQLMRKMQADNLADLVRMSLTV
jgi:two-component system, LuxR family, response regulator FixJ